MALSLAAGLKALIQGGNYDAQAALDVTLPGGTSLHMGTAEMILPGSVTYAPTLRTRGTVRQSLRKVTDLVELTAQNIDSALGLTIIGATNTLNASRAKFLYVFFALDGTDTVYVLERLEGELTAARISETEVRLKLVSDLAAGSSVAANRAVMKLCGYSLGKRGCDSTSGGFCSKDFFDAVNGCASKAPAPRILALNPGATNNQASFGGFIHRDGIGYNAPGSGPLGGRFNDRDPEDGVGVNGRGLGERHRLPYYMRVA